MHVTADNLKAAMGCDGKTAAVWAQPLDDACRKFGITTPARLSAFLAQVGHESDSLRRLVENVNYRADGLLRVWPSRFTAQTAAEYARQPERIANKVYGGRMGNGPEATGDGWRYRGRGPIQVTGKANYESIGELIQRAVPTAPDFVIDPDLMLEPRWGALAAAAYWDSHDLNELADAGQFERLTKRVNGGLIGWADRKARYDRSRKVLTA